MTGKELADDLFLSLEEGTPGNDPALLDRIDSEISKFDTDEMWRFAIAASARGSSFDGIENGYTADARGVHPFKNVRDAFAVFHSSIILRDGYKTAIAAMRTTKSPKDDR